MSTILLARIAGPLQLANADATIYGPVPSATQAKIGRAIFCNTSGSVVTITVGLTQGSATGAATTLISARSVSPGETYTSPELAGLVLNPGDVLRASASAATSITAAISGLTFS